MGKHSETRFPEAPQTPKAVYEPPRLEIVELQPEEMLIICDKNIGGCTPLSVS